MVKFRTIEYKASKARGREEREVGAEEGVLASLWRFLVGLAPSSLSSTSLPLSGEAKMSGDHHMRIRTHPP